jgi:Tfp pilus assembly protein PilX
MLRRLHRDERGVAMIASLAVAFVVLTLATVVVSQSIHSIETSGYERERLLSINAAEAGTNRWYAYLQTTPSVNMSTDAGCDAGTGKLTLSEVVQSGPAAAAFNAVATFYAADGTTTMSCATFNDTTFPSFAKIRSTGTINGAPNRTIETYVRLTPNYGGFGAAILTINTTTFGNSFTVTGNTGNDGDIYVLNGDLTVNNAMTLSGNVYVPAGTASLQNAALVKGSLWANGNVTLSNGATVQGDALSTSGNISGGVGGGVINDDATAGGTVNTSNLTVGGIVTSGVTMPTVPTQSFPQITSNTAPWIASGYTLVDLSTTPGTTLCDKAREWIKNRWSTSGVTNALIRINTTCTWASFKSGGDQNFSIPGHLAILSDGGFTLSNNPRFNGTTGSIKNIHFISVYSASCSGSTKDIVVSNDTLFNSFTNVSFYTPCRATLNNQNSFSGQVLAKDVSIGNNFKMAYEPVLVPGITGVTGFKQDISYIHE